MNFFEIQDKARCSSRRLVFLYIVSTALIIAGVSLIVGIALYGALGPGETFAFGPFFEQQASVLLATAIITAIFIAGATLVKTMQLSSGGGRVAQQMGGTLVPPDTRDPLRARLRNVVEEMAIASGVPVPEIYVLEHEMGINAFAAGYAPGDAAVAVTRGTLELLDRDELQGVIGHEFSHILNGDMRLNIRLMGVLFGIMALGLMGRMIFRGGYWSGASSRRGKGGGIVVIIGLGLIILGGIGVFCARLIKSGVSRQREYLADASAVQFTRQTDGIAGALKKIGGYEEGSLIKATDPEEVSHMLFGTGSKLSGMFATHPPLTERIQALDPNFNERDYPRVRPMERSVASERGVDQRGSGIAAATSALAAGISPSSISASVGQPTEEHISYATRIRQSLPESLYDAAHSSELSYLLVIALILDGRDATRERQLSLLLEKIGDERTRLIQQFYSEIQAAGAEYRLPLLEIAFPALRQRPNPQLEFLLKLTRRLIEIDGKVELHEFCFYRVLAANLRQVLHPSRKQKHKRAGREVVREAAVNLLRIVARCGHSNDQDAATAFAAGMSAFGEWGEDHEYNGDQLPTINDLEQSIDQLIALNAEGRQMLLDAVTQVVLHDELLTVPEAELVRTVCASLEIPLPPQIGVSLNSVPVSSS